MQSSAYDPFLHFAAENPELEHEIRQLNTEGQRLIDSDVDAAQSCFERILEICPVAPMAHNNLAVIHFSKGDFDKAEHHLRQTVSNYPEYLFALALLSRTQHRLGDREAAVTTLRQAVAAFRPGNRFKTDDADSVMSICHAFAELGDDLGLRDFFRRHGGLRSVGWKALAYAGVAAFNLGRYAQAKRYWRQAIQRPGGPDFLEALCVTADLIDRLTLPPLRLDYKLYTQKPDRDDPSTLTPTVLALLASSIWTGVDDEAGWCIRMLEVSPDPWVEQVFQAVLLQPGLSAARKTTAAAALYKRGALPPDGRYTANIDGKMVELQLTETDVPLGIDPRAYAVFERAHKLHKAGQIEAALEVVAEALTIDPGLHEARLHMASYYLELNRWDEAREMLRMIDADDLPALLVAHYWGLAGELASAMDAEHAAVAYFRTALDHAPDKMKSAMRARLRLARRYAEDQLDSYDVSYHQERRDRLLRQPVRPGMPLVEAYATLTKDNLIGMGIMRNLFLPPHAKKVDLVATLASGFAEHARSDQADFDDHVKEALDWLVSRGGVALFHEFEVKFGDPLDTVFWDQESPESPVNHLWALGWITVGTWRGHSVQDVRKYRRTGPHSTGVARRAGDGAKGSGDGPVIVVLPEEVLAMLQERE